MVCLWSFSVLPSDTFGPVTECERKPKRMLMYWVSGIIAVLLIMYLVYAMLKPEKF
ncbi:MAG: K(+)-transporting ATPase subunit F [Blastocatellia bacterium]|nr:K(+)-transporting ATPase subunit F [Blastocatellia bacterium]